MVTVTLSRRYTLGDKSIDALHLREPVWADYLALGPIEEWQPGPSDSAPMIMVRYHEVVGKYADRLSGDGSPYLTALDLSDTLAVLDAVRGFFTKARGLTSAPTN